MNLIRHLLLPFLLFQAINTSAQDFKIIEETKDYILKECDSAFYFSHGLPPKDDFVLDTTKIHKVNGVLKLPLDNGKEVVFRDTSVEMQTDFTIECFFEGFDSLHSYYLVLERYGIDAGAGFLVNKKDGSKEHIVDPPVLSPAKDYYGYIVMENYPGKSFVKIKKFKTNLTFSIELGKEKLYQIDHVLFLKWVNDNSFIYRTEFYDDSMPNGYNIKYYLVQIKQ